MSDAGASALDPADTSADAQATGPVGWLTALVRESPALPASLALVAALVALGASEAGYYPTTWYAAGLFALGLLAVALIALRAPGRPGRAQVAALGLLAAYVAWSYLSITWADQQGLAWEGANRSALYLLIFALASLWPTGSRGARVLLGTLGLGIAGIGLVELLRADAAARPLQFFIDVRLAEPAGYINANVALWTVGLLPCLFLASAREVWTPLRGLALGGAGLLGAVALMGQSRGWALALPPALVFFVALGPGRVRKLVVTLVTAAGVAIVSGPILALHDEFAARTFDSELGDATRAVLAMTAVLVLLGSGLAFADRRLEPSPAGLRRLRRGTAVAVAAAACVLAIAVVAAVGNPFAKVSDAWTTFKDGGAQAEQGTSRFTTAGTNRYDMWSVAWDLFSEHPLGGVGADGYQPYYLRLGTSDERPRFAHSLELGVLAQTGLVGALLLLAALVGGFVAALAAVRHGGRERAMAAAAALSISVYWLLHGSVDWFWEFPGLAGAAWLGLGLAGALAPRSAVAPEDAVRRTLPHRLIPALLALAALLLALSFAAPWGAELEIDAAAKRWVHDPDGAFERLDRADRLNPLSARADLTAGTIALRQGRLDRARAAFDSALERDPNNAYATLELGLLAAGAGQRREAERLLERAVAASPRDLLSRQALHAVRRGRDVSGDRFNRLLVERARARGSRSQ
ncbi:MAG TPA: O-antigen ligase family protein [Thermoleophilaceae bacterium]